MSITEWSGRLTTVGATGTELASITAGYYSSQPSVQQALDALVGSISDGELLVMLNNWRAHAGPFQASYPGGGLLFSTLSGEQGVPGVSAHFRNPPQWSAIITYMAGPPPDGVLGADGGFYYSTVDNNLNHDPVGDGGAHWVSGLPSTVVSDSSPHGATVGEGIVYNGAAFVGTDRSVDVWNTETNPAAETDWGAIINARLAAGNRTLEFAGVAAGVAAGRAYPFTTPIDASYPAVAFRGPGGKLDVYGNVGGIYRMPAYLLWTGGAVGPTNHAIKTHSSGPVIEKMGIYYEAGFDGSLIDLNNNSAGGLIAENDIGGLDQATATALCNISVSNCWDHVIRGNNIRAAQYNVLGVRDDGVVWSDSIRIIENSFALASVGHFAGIHRGWKFARNFIGMAPYGAVPGGTPAVIVPAPGVTGNKYATFVFEDNDIWDQNDSGTGDSPWFITAQNEAWTVAIFTNNEIQHGGTHPTFLLAGGGGELVIAHNRDLGTANGATDLIDLGDTSAGARPFGHVAIRDNYFNADHDPIIHRAGHSGLEIDAGANAYGGYVQPMHEIDGQERITKRLYKPPPTIAAQAALGSGAGVGILGNDIAGLIHLTPGSGAVAGDFAKITLGTPLVADPNGPYGYIAGHAGFVVHLTPTYAGDSPSGLPAAPVFYYWFDPTDNTAWYIGSKTAITSYDYWIAYRLMAL